MTLISTASGDLKETGAWKQTSQPRKVDKMEIIAVFKNGREIRFTMAVLDMLKSDTEVRMIYDAETGEIIYEG